MTLYHIELILNYKHLQEKTQKQRLHCICKKSKYVLNRFPYIHSCSEIVDLKRKTHHEQYQFLKKNLLDYQQMLLF